MDKKAELESTLLSITENYKRDFTSKFKKSNSFFDTIQSKYQLLNELQLKLSNELISVVNKYLDENKISNKSELDESIKQCYMNFIQFATTA